MTSTALGDVDTLLGALTQTIAKKRDLKQAAMNHTSIVEQKARMGQGDAVVHISARNLAKLNVRLPSESEQTAIAAALSDMDAELAALEARLAKTRALKQGMMQELLTGRTRLV